jgi:hypothetical protein
VSADYFLAIRVIDALADTLSEMTNQAVIWTLMTLLRESEYYQEYEVVFPTFLTPTISRNDSRNEPRNGPRDIEPACSDCP